jgi:hypothetical protein
VIFCPISSEYVLTWNEYKRRPVGGRHVKNRFPSMRRNVLWLGTALCVGLVLSLVVSLSSILPVGAETVGSWNSTTPWQNSSTTGITGESCATYSGYIYCVGGFLVGGPRSGVYYAPVSSSGVGTWTQTTSYPTGFDQGSCAISGGYIYCVGGEINGAGAYTNAVYYASVSASGVGAWTSTTVYPIIIEQESCAISSGYIYCVGGTSDESFPYTPGNGVFYAPVSASGVGAWTTSNFPTVIDGESCTISSGYIYCVGGDSVETPYTDIVFYAPVSASGVGAWTSTTHYPTDVTYTSCATYSGYIYCIGGFIDGTTFTNAVYYASVSSSGVGTWTPTTAYPNQTYLQSCPIYLGYIYCVGGQNAMGFISNLVYYSSVSGSIPPSTSSTSSTSSSTPFNACQSGLQCYTAFAVFNVQQSGSPAGGAIVVVTAPGFSSQISMTALAASTSLLCTQNPSWTAQWGMYWGCFAGETGQFTVRVGVTYSYTVTLTSGTVLTGTFNAPTPWTVDIVPVSA